MSPCRILFIDAYDSFSNNIVSLLETELPVSVTKIHIDSDVGDLSTFLRPFTAVVAGPGPGNPEIPNDVGLIAELWKLNRDALLPCLGICLGFQSLVLSFGGRIHHLPGPRHGVETCISTDGSSFFEGLKSIRSVQYHSLQAALSPCPSVDSITHTNVWKPTLECPDLIPLAWDFTAEDDTSSDSSANSRGILMAVKHQSKPFYGIQFHPESVCSSEDARCVVKNWWALCLQWLRDNRPHKLGLCYDIEVSGSSQDIDSRLHSQSARSTPDSAKSLSTSSSHDSLSSVSSYSSNLDESRGRIHCYQQIPLGHLSVPIVAERLGLATSETVVLDSERRQMQGLGSFSIIGLIEPNTRKFTYSVGSRTVKVTKHNRISIDHLNEEGSIFPYLRNILNSETITRGPQQIPFWGGLMGYIAYEACLETIKVHSVADPSQPDLCFAFIERSILIDHANRKVYIQSIKSDDLRWVMKTQETLLHAAPLDLAHSSIPRALISRCIPDISEYKRKISLCQREIREGNSYELCLTDQSTVNFPRSAKSSSSWNMYLELRELNPAPFASFVRLGPATVLSTSPERFMSWTRPKRGSANTFTSTCQFRPIKGTVSRTQMMSNGKTRQVSLQEATAILSTQKERAENLMIVDLIRHDIHGVVGSGNVAVKSLMAVEEYESVFQLVSVIEGTISNPDDPRTRASGPSSVTGIDVLAASLPPGSMTGAPKKRSCEILQNIEDKPRSIYSGVVGYMCVGGGGDFSVVIRTIYKWDDHGNDGNEEWNIGAGGAITALSNEDDEWEEMLAKLRSTMRLFDD